MSRPGTFPPGFSGNPNGARGFREVVRLLTRLGNEKASKKARYTRLENAILGQYTAAAKGDSRAATLLFHYIAGKPREAVEVQQGPSEMMMQLMRMIGQGAFVGREDELRALQIEHSDADNG